MAWSCHPVLTVVQPPSLIVAKYDVALTFPERVDDKVLVGVPESFVHSGANGTFIMFSSSFPISFPVPG